MYDYKNIGIGSQAPRLIIFTISIGGSFGGSCLQLSNLPIRKIDSK